jgi:hypothetical protein
MKSEKNPDAAGSIEIVAVSVEITVGYIPKIGPVAEAGEWATGEFADYGEVRM